MANPKQATNGSSNGHNNKGTPENNKGTPEPKPAVGAAGIKNGVKPNEEEHHLPNGNLVKKTNNITCQMGIW